MFFECTVQPDIKIPKPRPVGIVVFVSTLWAMRIARVEALSIGAGTSTDDVRPSLLPPDCVSCVYAANIV
jgi:hypothetical protein